MGFFEGGEVGGGKDGAGFLETVDCWVKAVGKEDVASLDV